MDRAVGSTSMSDEHAISMNTVGNEPNEMRSVIDSTQSSKQANDKVTV